MAVFKRRDDLLPWQQADLGSRLRFEIPRDFHTEALFLRLHWKTDATAAGTTNRDGAVHMAKRVRLTVADGARTRNVIDCSGGALVGYSRQVCSAMPTNTLGTIATSIYPGGYAASTEYDIIYPMWFMHPQVQDPLASAFLLPTPRFNTNPVLEVDLSTTTDMSSGGTLLAAGTGYFSATKVHACLYMLKREVNIPNWRTFDHELIETSQSFPALGANQAWDLPVPGSYTGILIRSFVPDTATGKLLFKADSEIKLQALGQVFRRTHWDRLMYENDMSFADPQLCRSASWGEDGLSICPDAYFDFLSDRFGDTVGELGSVFDTNPYMGTGARPQLLFDVARNNAASSSLKITTHRIFGDLSELKLLPR